MAQHHQTEAQTPACRACGNVAVFTPIDLGGFAGAEVEFEKRRTWTGSDAMHVVFDNGAPAIKTSLAQALVDLLGAVRVGIEPAHDLALVGVEFAGPLHASRTGAELLDIGPFGNGANIQTKSTRGLRVRSGVGGPGGRGSGRRFHSRARLRSLSMSWARLSGAAFEWRGGTGVLTPGGLQGGLCGAAS